MSLSVDTSPAVCDSEESGGEHVLNDSQLQWVDCVELIGGFNTVEHFWNVLMTNPKMSDLPNGTDALTFKSHIAPKWEDPRNENGGRWLISNLNKEDADRYWEEILMLMVGSAWETDKEDEQVCGAVFQSRSRGSKLAIWTSDCSDSETVMRIGTRMKSVVQHHEPLYYQTVEEQKSLSRGVDYLSATFKIE